jgi:predicted aspartyl protease
MISRNLRCANILFSALLFVGLSGARAEECRLSRVTELDMSITKDKLLVPVSIGGVSKFMAIDTGASASVVDPVAADDLHLVTHRYYENVFVTAAGVSITQIAIIPRLDMGPLYAENIKALVWPSPLGLGNNVAGTLGADLLHNYDADIDFGTGKFSLFSKDHCPGKVIYWPAPVVAVVPIHVTNTGHIVLPVALDGHQFDAVLDTGSDGSFLSLEAAYGAFGLSANSPGMFPTGDIHGVLTVPAYRHTFKTLEFEGITIGNPTLYLWDNLSKYNATQHAYTGSRLTDVDQQDGVTDMIIGIHELHNLHLYIAYGEQKLYVTPASPPASAAKAQPATSGPSAAAH